MRLLYVIFARPRIPVDPVTKRCRRSLIRVDLWPHCEGECMVPVNLLTNCKRWTYGSNIRYLDFWGSVTGSDPILSVTHFWTGRFR